MKVIIAPQAFKGTLTAFEVARAMEQAVQEVFPGSVVVILPIADGGDGTLATLLHALGGKKIPVLARNAQGRPHQTAWGHLPDGTAVIECAKICGLADPSLKNKAPLTATTFGVGEVIYASLAAGCRKLLIGLGGTATNDGGVGLLQALGAVLLDQAGMPLSFGGGALQNLHSLDLSPLDPRLSEVEITVACDVSNVVLGPEGATRVYGKQKGAKEEEIPLLEGGLEQLITVIEKTTGKEVRSLKGGGAAGGMGATLAAVLGGTLCPGSELILEKLEFAKHLEGADLVLTGEGCLDKQTFYHKGPHAVAQAAQGVPVVAIVGSVGEGWEAYREHGFYAVYSLSDPSVRHQ